MAETEINIKEKLNNSYNDIVEVDGIKKIEEWTGMKVRNIIFDSDIDNLKKGTTLFDQVVLNQSNLIILIEDEDDNLFGGYVNAKVSNIGRLWIKDSNAFVFSLKSNGRLNGMMKFDIMEPQYAFLLFEQTFEGLFLIGYRDGFDICVYKELIKNPFICNQTGFDYKGIENALCGKAGRLLKRLTIIQLI